MIGPSRTPSDGPNRRAQPALAGWPEVVAIILIAGGGLGVLLGGSSVGAIVAFAGFTLAFRRYLDGVRREPARDEEDHDWYWN
jgi:hypothetical protein